MTPSGQDTTQSTTACALCRRPFAWYRWRNKLECCGLTICSRCSTDFVACQADGHEHHHVALAESMNVPLPEQMRRGDFNEVRVCKTLGEKLAREIYDDPMLRSAKVAYDKGHKAGYEEGYRVGYEEGYRDGEAAGDRRGYSRGHDDGKTEGQRDSDD